MSSKIPTAAFSFDNYKIKKFTFEEPNVRKGFHVEFNPSGTYFPNEGVMLVLLVFKAWDDNTDIAQHEKSPAITVELETKFNFSSGMPIEDLPNFFYKNSIAIIYPYIRAFVTSLTAQANIKPLILPLLNLSSLEEDLKKNISISNDSYAK